MTTEKLKEILEKHKKWLKGKEGGKCADLSNADLSHANLSNANLSHAFLCSVDLSNADLSHAVLHYANLSNADLCGANLDYSALPLWCGSLKTHFDDKQIIQFIYHAVKAGLYSKNVSPEIKEELKKLAPLANKFHLAEECGKIEEL